MSEHKELLAAIANLAQQQNRTNELLEKIVNADPATAEDTQPPTREQIAADIKEATAPTNSYQAAKDGEDEPTQDDLKKALMAHSKAHSKESAKALMGKYGNAKKIDDVPAPDRAALIAELEG